MTIGASIAQAIWDDGRWTQAIGVVPAYVFAPLATADGQVIPVWLTFFAYLFLHGGWWHVIPNMVGLWLFGAIVEPVMGTRRFLLAYVVSGVVGACGLAIVLPNSTTAAAGASLAISGLVGAYAAERWMSRPRSRLQRLLTTAFEAALVSGIATWLVIREAPTKADLICSVVYHVIPFFAMWLAVRVVTAARLAWLRRGHR